MNSHSAPDCVQCGVIKVTKGDTCSTCRNLGERGRKLDGGQWVRVGLVQRWVAA